MADRAMTTGRPRKRVRIRPLAIAIGAVLLAACSAGAPSSAPGSDGAALPPRPAPQADVAQAQPAPPAQPERKLTYTADVVLRGRDPWALADQAKRIPGDLGGDLLSLVQSGQGDSRSARLTMRVPAEKFEDALARLRKLDAEIVSSRIDTKDVTDQFVDLNARLASKQREEQQLLSLLSQAKTVDDTLKVSQALGRTRTEVEQLTGQLNALKGRIDLSTITVTIDNVADLTTQSAWAPARTAAQALVALVSLLKFLGDLVIWLIIVGWVPALIVFGSIRLRRLYRRWRPSAPRVPPAPAGTSPHAGA